MNVTETRHGPEFVVYAHSWKNEVVAINYGPINDATDPDKFCEILHVNYLRAIAIEGTATVGVMILATGLSNIVDAAKSSQSFVAALSPRWQAMHYDPDYDRKMNKHVICVETGEVYSSINAAADTLGIAQPSLNNAVRYPNRRLKVDGKRWVRTSLPFTVR